MKARTKEEMAAYQRERRKRVTPCNTQVVTPVKCNTLDVTPVTPSHRCKVLEAKVVLLEKELELYKERRLVATANRVGHNPDPVELFQRVVREKEARLQA